MLDKKAVETLSVSAVKNCIDVCDLLSQFITENDKTPIWDGHVHLYNKPGKKSADCRGKVYVQVKGKESKDFSKDEISYQVTISNLRCYKTNGGAIYFVPYVKNEHESKIYYNAFTPNKIKELMKNLKKGQQKLTVKFKAFPSDNKEKEILFLNFFEHCQKQISFISSDNLSIEELKNKGLFDGIVIPVTTVNGVSFETALLQTESSLYAKIKGTEILQPLDGVVEHQALFQEIYEKISVGDTQFYDKYTLERTKDYRRIIIGNSFSVTIKNENEPIKVNYSGSHMARVLEKDLAFMIAFAENRSLKINGNEMISDESYEELNLSSFPIDTNKEYLGYVKSVVQVLDYLGCADDIDIVSMSERDKRNLSILISAIVEGKEVENLKEDLNPATILPLGNHRFILYVNKTEDGTYEIEDFFKANLAFAYEGDDGEMIPTSVFCVLGAEELVSVDNIPFDEILPSFQSFERNKDTMVRANLYLLELLKAYDMDNSKTKLIDIASQFADWIFNTEDDNLPYEIRAINYYQVNKRLNKLSDKDKADLFLIAEKTEHIDIKIAAYLLLDQQIPAMMYFKKLSEPEQKKLLEYPISVYLPKDDTKG